MIARTNIYSLIFLTFVIPTIGMVAGLSVATTVTIFLIILSICLKGRNFPLDQIKAELSWCLWCVVSCFWSISPLSRFIEWTKLFTIIFLGLLVKNNINRFNNNLAKMQLSFALGICLAIILFLIEYLSHGALFKAYRNIFQPASQQYFYLYMLDRGCALLSLLSWVIIGILIKYQKQLLAVIFYISALWLLSISDSLASFLGLAVGGIGFCICKLLTAKLLRFISSALVVGSLMMPIFAYNINPRAISEQYGDVLPISSIHRIFIWHFVTNKVIDKPLFGWGFGASRQYKINNNEMVQYQSHSLSPLPLHPHNNILQICFETGFVGLVLFLLLLYKYSNNIVEIIITGRETANSAVTNFGLVSYACFLNYYLIGMVSFSIWQLWWVSSAIWSGLMMSLLVKPKQNSCDNL